MPMYERTFRLIPTIIVSLLCWSCAERDNTVDTILDYAELISGTNPSKSLETLEDARERIKTNEDKARYALVKTIAMDNAGEKYKSDSLIRVAEIYYNKKGTADEKLKSYYYTALAHYNNGDYEEAMKWLVLAGGQINQSSNHVLSGKAYEVCAKIYGTLKDPEKELYYTEKAKDQFYIAGDNTKYLESSINVSLCHLSLEHIDSAYTCLNDVRPFYDSLDSMGKSHYFKALLLLNSKRGVDLKSDIEEYLKSCDEKDIAWTQLAKCYTSEGNYKAALSALMKYASYNPDHMKEPDYLESSSEVLSALGDYESSLVTYKAYKAITDSLENDLFQQDTRYIKERYNNMLALEHKEMKQTVFYIISSVILIFFAMIALANRSRIRAIKTKMKEQIKVNDSLEKEVVCLMSQLKDRTELKTLKAGIMLTRFRLLNAIFASWIENDGSLGTRISNTLNKTVEDRQSFMSSLLIAFETEYPQYIEYLRSHDLNENELNIACLYTIGLSCKSIINYTGKSRQYNDNSSMRSKLEIPENDNNIGKHLRAKFEESIRSI